MKKKKKTNNKALNIVMTILKTLVVVILVLFVLVVCLQRFTNNKMSFFNYRMFTVVSGSMEPKYNIGDVLIAKEVAPDKIKVGDAVSYLGKSGSFADKVITHQVESISKDDAGHYKFQTKGLTNIIEDPTVDEDQLYGVVIYRSFTLSLIYKIVGTKIGMFLFVIIPLMFIIGSEILTAMLENEEKRRERMKSSN